MNRMTTVAMGAVLGCVGAPAIGQLGSFEDSQPDPSSVRLISEHTALVAGEVGTIALAFELDPGWHLYWDGQNDTGMPVSVSFEKIEGWKIGELMAPVPERHVSAGDLLDHVLVGSPMMLIPVTVPVDAAGTSVTIRGSASWLVCQESCLLDDESFEITLAVVSPGETIKETADAGVIVAARAALPENKPSEQAWFTTAWESGRLIVRAIAEGTIEFYPAGDSIPISGLLESGASDTGLISLKTKEPASEKRASVRGVVSVHSEDGTVRSAWINTSPVE